ncbi:MAG: pitrilysin family protein [Planctomycetaceae bacterium]
MNHRNVAWLMFSLLLIPSARAIAEEQPIKKITSVEGITEYRLANGMKVLLFPDPSKPTVTVNLTIFVGSRHEGYGEAGMAHLLEHMVFKGTPTHKNIPKALQDRGARFNGTTWLDRTNYFETLPSQGDNLEFALRLEADRMMNSLIRAEDLKSEMSVVRNEFERGENNPRSILGQRMMSAAFEWHNYGRSTIGNRADIERVPVKNLRAFYRKYYQPDNAMLVVAGKFKPSNALKLINKYFGSIPKPTRKLPNTYTEEPPQDGERVVTLRRVGDVPVVGTLYHIPAGAHPEYASIDVLESILTAAPAGRLYKSLVETKKAASVSGAAFALHDPGVLRFLATVTKGNDPQVVLGSMLDTLEMVADEGVTKEEVDRAKQRLLKQWELASANSRQIAIQLSEWAAQGDWRLYFLYRDRVEKVTVASVNQVAKKYLKRNNRTVGLFIPTKAPEKVVVPATPSLASMIGDYKGRKVITQGEAFDVTPANIEARTTRDTIAGGIKVALLPKKNRGQTVTLRLTLRYGNAKNLQNLATAAEFLPSLMTRGTKKLSRQQLQDQLDKQKTRLNAGGRAGTITFTMQTKRENLPAALKLLHQVLREPTLPESELDILKGSAIAGYQSSLTSPQALATTFVRRKLDVYPKNDPRYVPSIQEEIERTQSLKIEDVRKLYKEFLGAKHASLVIVGDFDPEKTLPVLSESLSGWESSKPYQRLSRNATPPTQGVVKDILTPGKANAVYFAATSLAMKDSHPDYPALVLGNFILGGGSLASRLGVRVRQKEGLSYGVGSGLSASALDKRAVFYIFAISNPKNMAKAKIAIKEEFDRILKDGVTPDELANAKKGYLRSQQISRTNDGQLASLLEGTISAKRTMEFYSQFEKQIKSVTAEDVKRALQKHFDWKKLHIVAAGDFKAASKTSKKAVPKTK